MLLFNTSQIRNAEAAAIHVEGLPPAMLIQNAAGHVARAALEIMGAQRSAVVFCGIGRNGADGIATAEMLLRHGVVVHALLLGEPAQLQGDALGMERRLRQAGGMLERLDPDDDALPARLRQAGVLIDALFGLGLDRPLRGAAAKAVELMNQSGVPVVAVDVPSGVEADTGAVLGSAVRCRRTVTFPRAKPGHFIEPGCEYCGEVAVCSVGMPAGCLSEEESRMEAVFAADVSLPRRPALSHKGDYGRLLILAGSVGYTGAPNLCARAAVRAGAGLVQLGVPRSIWGICAVKNDEAMPFPLPEDEEGRLSEAALPALREKLERCDTLVVGPGLGRGEGVRALVRALLRETEKPTVLDADALWALCGDTALLRACRAPLILTPHAGEFHALRGDLTGERACDARLFAANTGCTLVLKGHRTLCAFPDGRVGVICAGNPGMARGGSGDVLAGVLGALLGQCPDRRKAVLTACWLHAAAGDACAAEKGEYGMTPTDMIEALPGRLRAITRNE